VKAATATVANALIAIPKSLVAFMICQNADQHYVVGGAIFCAGIFALFAYLCMNWEEKQDDQRCDHD